MTCSRWYAGRTGRWWASTPAALTVPPSAAIRTPVPVTGPRSVTVPGAVSGWASLLELGGSIPAAELLLPAVALAEDGVRVSAGLAAGIGKLVGAGTAGSHLLRLLDGSRSEEDLLRQPALAQTLRTLADEGLSSLYDGRVGDRLARGLVTSTSRSPAKTCARTGRSWRSRGPWRPRTSGCSRRRRTPRATCCSQCSAPASASAAFPTSTSPPWSLSSRGPRSAALAELADPRYLTLGKHELLEPGRLLTGTRQDRRATAGRHRRHRGRHCRVVRRDGGVADPVAVPLLRLTASRARDRRHPAQPRLDVLRRPGLAQPPGARQATRPHADAGDRRARRRPCLRPGCDGRSRPAADPPAAAAAHPHRPDPATGGLGAAARRTRRRRPCRTWPREPDSVPTVSRRCCCRPSATRSATR